MAEESKRLDAALIHYSTDYVFDGNSDKPYRESDTPTPINFYGRSKLAGDQAIEAVGARHPFLAKPFEEAEALGETRLDQWVEVPREISKLRDGELFRHP